MGKFQRISQSDRLMRPFEAGVITASEADLMRNVEELRYEAIMVDSFTVEQYKAKKKKNLRKSA